jgi:hypothetical protein
MAPEAVALAQEHGEQRHAQRRRGSKQRRHAMHRTLRLAAGPTMNPGVSTRDTTGNPIASAERRKRAALSDASLSTAPPSCWQSLASTPTARPARRASPVMTLRPNTRRSSQNCRVEQHVDDAAHRIAPAPILGQQVAKLILVAGFPGTGTSP